MNTYIKKSLLPSLLQREEQPISSSFDKEESPSLEKRGKGRFFRNYILTKHSLRNILFCILIVLFSSASVYADEQKKEVMVITVNGVINPVSAEFFKDLMVRRSSQ